VPSGNAGHSGETAGDKPEEGGDDVKSSWPLWAGLHTCYNGGDSGLQCREAVPIPKSHLSSDCTLQLECMKLESLVIADQLAAVNTFPGLTKWKRMWSRIDNQEVGLEAATLERVRNSSLVK